MPRTYVNPGERISLILSIGGETREPREISAIWESPSVSPLSRQQLSIFLGGEALPELLDKISAQIHED